ncbi:MAG: FAD-dependent oxidoreductase [Gemmatimonadetes bacterium]|nr:FAD-dependent oxidoreductase [Gemmatimonadota bacterium]
MSGARTVVVGGGVVGVCCAYALAREGLDVVLLERGEVASGASRGNAGTVSAGHPPLNRPGRIRQAVFQMLDPKSPLYVPPRWDPELWRWLLSFARHCTDAHVERCMSVMAPLGIEALESFDRLIEEEHIDCGYRSEGYFEVCTTEKGIARARHEASIIGRSGYHPEVVDAHELRRREPEFGHEVVGGVHYPEARTLDPYRFVTAVMELARDRGVELRERVSVASVATDGGRVVGVRTEHGDFVGADHVVLATGPFSLELARRLGVRLPVQPGKGYHRDVAVGPAGAPPLRTACVLNETSVFCTPMDGFVRFAGTMEFSGLNQVMRPARLRQLTDAARTCFPRLGDEAPISEWCGLRPMSVDGLPIVGPLAGIDGLSIATGHGMLGLTLAPVTGRIIAKQVTGVGEARYRSLAPERFG